MSDTAIDILSLVAFVRDLPSVRNAADAAGACLVTAAGLYWGELKLSREQALEIAAYTVNGAYDKLDAAEEDLPS